MCAATLALRSKLEFARCYASGCLVASDLELVREMADPSATAWVDHRQSGLLSVPWKERSISLNQNAMLGAHENDHLGLEPSILSELAGSVGDLTHTTLKSVA